MAAGVGDGFDLVSYEMGRLDAGGGGGGDITVESKSISANGTYTAPTGKAYSPVVVSVPNSYAAGDEGKVVSNGALVAQTAHAEVTSNGTIDTTLNNSVVVNVSGGGGGGSVSPKQVNFVDYDGTILYAYTKAEANALSALPANPSHAGLTAQGWNWSLAEIKAQLTAVPDGPVWVGQMYVTASGDTEIDVRMQDGRLSPILTIAVNGTVTVNWGDGTTADTATGSSLSTRQSVPHTYAAPGDYTIKIHVVSGSFTFYGTTSYTLLRKNTTQNENYVYANCAQAVRLGSGVTSIGNNAFNYCYSLAYVTIPSGVTSIGSSAFYYCYSLAYVTIPSGVTSIGSNAFYYCYSLASITIPSSATSIGASAFYYCYSLASITIPSGVTDIGTGALSYCYSLASITIPSGVTSIGAGTFSNCCSLAYVTIQSGVTSIGNNAFSNCQSLASITIPNSVTSIGNSAFNNCYGVAEYHIKPTTPPTLGTTPFNNIVSDCVIYVPSAKVNDYKGATGWSTYASYMQGE